MKEYVYTIREEAIDYYKITSTTTTVTDTKTDDYGNTVTTKSYVTNYTNTYSPNGNTPDDPDPDDPPVRYADNQLTVRASYLTGNGSATDADFAKLSLNKKGQVLNITLKQLNLIWKPVDVGQGAYLETYNGYSGYETNLTLTRRIYMMSFAPLWETMKEKKVTVYALIYKHKVSRSMVDKLKHDRNVTLATVERLCEILDCRVEDVVVYEKDESGTEADT